MLLLMTLFTVHVIVDDAFHRMLLLMTPFTVHVIVVDAFHRTCYCWWRLSPNMLLLMTPSPYLLLFIMPFTKPVLVDDAVHRTSSCRWRLSPYLLLFITPYATGLRLKKLTSLFSRWYSELKLLFLLAYRIAENITLRTRTIWPTRSYFTTVSLTLPLPT